jgi:hypothetical protein
MNGQRIKERVAVELFRSLSGLISTKEIEHLTNKIIEIVQEES